MNKRPLPSAPGKKATDGFGEGMIVGALLFCLLTGFLIMITGWAQS